MFARLLATARLGVRSAPTAWQCSVSLSARGVTSIAGRRTEVPRAVVAPTTSPIDQQHNQFDHSELSQRAAAAAAPDFSLEMKEPELVSNRVPVDAGGKRLSLTVPRSLPAPDRGWHWEWFPAIRSAALCPADWHAYRGDGRAFGMAFHRAVVTSEASAPTAAAPAAIALSVTAYAGAFTQRVVKTGGLGEFLAAYHMLRTAPPSALPPGATAPDAATSSSSSSSSSRRADEITAAGIALENLGGSSSSLPAPPASGFEFADSGDNESANGSAGAAARVNAAASSKAKSGRLDGKHGDAPSSSDDDGDDDDADIDADLLRAMDEKFNRAASASGGASNPELAAAMAALRSQTAAATGATVGWPHVAASTRRGSGTSGSGSGSAGTPSTAIAPSAPVVHASWKHDVADGVTIVGVEYSTAHSDLVDKARGSSGTRYYLSLVLNSLEDVVYEVEFRAPEAEWRSAWHLFGENMTDQLFLNWSDESPARFQ